MAETDTIDAGTGTTDDQDQTSDTTDRTAYWEREAKKAFRQRDELKGKIRDLEGRVMSDDDRQLFDTLRQEREKTEEQRKRKEGEWDSLRNQLVQKHETERHDLETKLTAANERLRHSVKLAQFGAASDYFGGDAAKTVLDAQLAMDVLGKYVSVEDTDDDPMGYQVVVKKPNGETILADDGRPAPFHEAMGELIKSLPNKDRILRGSGKTGSGSSGGKTGTHGEPPDLQTLTDRARRGDKDALAALKQRQASPGGIVFGSAFSR